VSETDRAPVLPRVTRVAAYALARDGQGRLLLCRMAQGQPGAGKWTLPGGGLDFGEDPEAGVLRELAEETGLGGRVIDAVGVTSRVVRQRRGGGEGPEVEMHAMGICFRVEVTGGELRNETDGSTDRCAWFTLAEIPSLPHTHLVASGLGFLARRG
jgi:8-oxo-dGTP diphosphatase